MGRNPLRCLLSLGVVLGFLSCPGEGSVAGKAGPLSSAGQFENMQIYPEAVGQLGGYAYSAAWQNSYAYVGIGPQLVVLDVSDPASPVVIGRSSVQSDSIRDLFISGNYAYLALGSGGMRILDISNPANVRDVGLFIGSVYFLTVADNFAYVCLGNQLVIVDVHEPDNPIQVGSFQIDVYQFISVVITAPYAYVGYSYWDGTDDGMLVIDVSDPANPSEVAHINIFRSAINIFIAGNYAYVADGGLTIFDITDPTVPVEISTFDTPGSAQDVYVAGKYAYIADNTSGLCIVDIGHPNLPQMVGSLDTPGVANSIQVAGNYAYIADYNAGLRVIDVYDLAAPVEDSYYQDSTLQSSRAIEVQGNYAYVADSGGDYFGDAPKPGFRIFDISNVASPLEIASLNTPYTIYDLAVVDDYAYLAAGDGGLRIIDVSDPSHPNPVGGYMCTDRCPADMAIGVNVLGNYAYLATYYDGVLVIIDVANPAAPELVGFLDTPGMGTNLAVRGNLVYLTDLLNGLHIIDTVDPVWPVEISLYRTPGAPWDVVLVGNYAYVADWAGGLRILEISDPANPYEVGAYTPSQACGSVSIVGDYAYLSCSDAFRIVDVKNPSSPFEVGSFHHDGFSYGAEVRGNNLFVAYGQMGLVAFRMLTDKITSLIPVDGGSLTSTDGQTTIDIPAGAFTQTADITFRQLLFDEYLGYWDGIDRNFEISAYYTDTGETADIASGQTITITLAYSDTQVSPVFEDSLALYNWNGITWGKETTSTLDPVKNVITATPEHLSLWALLSDTNRVYLPILRR